MTTTGCGVHVHDGFSCENATLQGGHYYIGDTDPWLVERYSSNDIGTATFSGVVDIGGTALLDGRAFVLHEQDGSRVACGILEPVTQGQTFAVETISLQDSGVSSTAFLATGMEGLEVGEMCFFGLAKGLEPNLKSFLEGGEHCTASNGCGVHIHEGLGCENGTTQMGHFYDDSSSLLVGGMDPWKLVGYEKTSNNGEAYFADCVQTGGHNATDYDNRAFIVHADDGSRKSCGLLRRDGELLQCSEDDCGSGAYRATSYHSLIGSGAWFILLSVLVAAIATPFLL